MRACRLGLSVARGGVRIGEEHLNMIVSAIQAVPGWGFGS